MTDHCILITTTIITATQLLNHRHHHHQSLPKKPSPQPLSPHHRHRRRHIAFAQSRLFRPYCWFRGLSTFFVNYGHARDSTIFSKIWRNTLINTHKDPRALPDTRSFRLSSCMHSNNTFFMDVRLQRYFCVKTTWRWIEPDMR